MLDLIRIVSDSRELTIALLIIARYIVAYQRGLSWTEYRMVHSLKLALFPILDKLVPSYPFVKDKGYTDDSEFVLTHSDDMRSTWRKLIAAQGSPHLINSVKRRETPEGDQLSKAHIVWMHSDGRQTEAYLFDAIDGKGTDVYAHEETSVLRGLNHLTSTQQVDGDARKVVINAFLD